MYVGKTICYAKYLYYPYDPHLSTMIMMLVKQYVWVNLIWFSRTLFSRTLFSRALDMMSFFFFFNREIISNWWPNYSLVGGDWNFIYFPIYWEWECHHPNWQTHIFQRGRSTTNQFRWVTYRNLLRSFWAPWVMVLVAVIVTRGTGKQVFNPHRFHISTYEYPDFAWFHRKNMFS